MLFEKENRLVYQFDAEKLWLEPWGPNALRVRATKCATMPMENWALSENIPDVKAEVKVEEKSASITNGNIKAVVTKAGKLTICNAATGKLLLEEYHRNRADVLDPNASAIEVEGREFKPIIGGDYNLTMRFESVDRNEKLYGMGQYQHEYLDLKGLDLEMAQRNSQASVPFLLSSLGYGLMWNSPSIGRAVLGKNIMSFEAQSTKALDYWLVAGDTPAEINHAYANVAGKVPMMPEYGLGFWQCKLRYTNQAELLGVAREYKKRELPIDLIVIDFFHWVYQGEWSFDKRYWPDPAAMVAELKDLGIELMVSIWPQVDKRSENYAEMVEKGLLVRTERGIRTTHDFMGETVHYDATNPEARDFVWKKAKQHYWDLGIKVFWLDEAEPEYSIYSFDNYRYHLGSDMAIGNIYPVNYAQGFYEGQTAAGQKNVVNLLRCAWLGSQKYGALVWSGDISSSWGSFRNQLAAGLNMGLAGIPWWTTDIGGFHGGDTTDKNFHELFIRWFQWGAFCPVMRLHGDREPHSPPPGPGALPSGGPNEVWSYGEEVYEICKKYMLLRESMRDYTRELMKEAHEKGNPVIRTCFYEFPEDKQAWDVEDQYMYGYKYLVAPVLYPQLQKRSVYLPKGGKWKALDGGEELEGGKTIEVDCPLDSIPVFVRQ